MTDRQLVPFSRSSESADRLRQMDARLSLHERSTNAALMDTLQLLNVAKSELVSHQVTLDEERQARRLLEHSTRTNGGVLAELASRLQNVEKRSTEEHVTLGYVSAQTRVADQLIRKTQLELASSRSELNARIKELQQELTSISHGEQRIQQVVQQLGDEIQDCKTQLQNYLLDRANFKESAERVERQQEELRRETGSFIAQQKQRHAQECNEHKQTERLFHEKLAVLSDSLASQTSELSKLQDTLKQQQLQQLSAESAIQGAFGDQLDSLSNRQQQQLSEIRDQLHKLSGKHAKRQRTLLTLANTQNDCIDQLTALRADAQRTATKLLQLDCTAQVNQLNSKVSNSEQVLRAEISSRRSNEQQIATTVSNLEQQIALGNAEFRQTLLQLDNQIKIITEQVTEIAQKEKKPLIEVKRVDALERKQEVSSKRLEELQVAQKKADERSAEFHTRLQNEQALISRELKDSIERLSHSDSELQKQLRLLTDQVAETRKPTPKEPKKKPALDVDDKLGDRVRLLEEQFRLTVTEERSAREEQIAALEKRCFALQKQNTVPLKNADNTQDHKVLIERLVRQEVDKLSAAGSTGDLRQLKQKIQKIEQIQERELREHGRRLAELEKRIAPKKQP